MDADTHGVPAVELRSVFGFNGEFFFLWKTVWKLRPSAQERLTQANATITRINGPNSTEKSQVLVLAELSTKCLFLFFIFFPRPSRFGPAAPPGQRAPDLPSGICAHFEVSQRRQARAPAGTHQRRLLSLGVQEWITPGLWTGGLSGL